MASHFESLRSSRRGFLTGGLRGAGALGLALLAGRAVAMPAAHAAGRGADGFGPLQPPDANGLRLPPGFSSRIVGTALEQPVASSAYLWHRFPDGGAVFATPDGGWIYASNSERTPGGGVGCLRFDAEGAIIDAYSILSNTRQNCAGGPTPWQTWLSCEEKSDGVVYECDPFSPGSQGVARPAMGLFRHEAAAVDSAHQHVYLTEDNFYGLLYRFAPGSYPDLSAGTLEAAEILDPGGQGAIQPGQLRPLAWHTVPNPQVVPTRTQVPAATPFAGGEGCGFEGSTVYITTKNNNRVWALDTDAGTIRILYDLATSGDPELSGVDNVYGAPNGDVYVAEDRGDMQIVALTRSGDVKPIVEVDGQRSSEVTGLALSPDGTRLYFSSQRGPGPSGSLGLTYEVLGPFVSTPAPGLGGSWGAILAALLGGAPELGQRGGA